MKNISFQNSFYHQRRISRAFLPYQHSLGEAITIVPSRKMAALVSLCYPGVCMATRRGSHSKQHSIVSIGQCQEDYLAIREVD